MSGTAPKPARATEGRDRSREPEPTVRAKDSLTIGQSKKSRRTASSLTTESRPSLTVVRIVTVAKAFVPSDASPDCTARPTVNVSVGSTIVSLRIVFVMVSEETFVPNEITAFATPTKSEPATAVPLRRHW